jgi:Uma2 family endonuclease
MTPVASPQAPGATALKSAGWLTAADMLHQLGDVDAERVRMTPRPGTATLEDLIAANESKEGRTYEWVDGTLVEKPMGQRESWVTAIIIGEFYIYLRSNDVGMLYGPDGVMEILPGIGRAPDVAYLSWASLPGGKPPPASDRVPAVVPDLAVEVLSESNTSAEMERKREEYFRAGVKLVWEIDPETRSAKVYTSPTAAEPIPPDGTLDGRDLLPGFQLSLKAVFDLAERRA